MYISRPSPSIWSSEEPEEEEDASPPSRSPTPAPTSTPDDATLTAAANVGTLASSDKLPSGSSAETSTHSTSNKHLVQDFDSNSNVHRVTKPSPYTPSQTSLIRDVQRIHTKGTKLLAKWSEAFGLPTMLSPHVLFSDDFCQRILSDYMIQTQHVLWELEAWMRGLDLKHVSKDDMGRLWMDTWKLGIELQAQLTGGAHYSQYRYFNCILDATRLIDSP